jgi:hypothetical protein
MTKDHPIPESGYQSQFQDCSSMTPIVRAPFYCDVFIQ